jgi:hypothetical protein
MWTVVTVDENTQLSYAPQVNPSPLTVGSGNGSLEIVITNPARVGIAVKYVEFTIKVAGDASIPPYPDSTALTTTTADIKTVVSDSNWTVEPPQTPVTHGGARYRLKPMTGLSLEIPAGGAVVVQIYDFPINIVAGTSTIQIKEDTAHGVALPSFTVTTFPWGFAFSDLTANVADGSGWKPVAQVAKGNSVTLFWHGSVLDVGSYTIYYSDSNGQQTRTPTKFGEWTSPDLTEDTVFTLGVSTNNNVGEPLQASMSVAVSVSEPDLVANSLAVNNVGIGTSPQTIPLTFKDETGDKISLWDGFGFGIQSRLLQIHTDGSGSDIAFGSGTSASFAETMRITGNGHVGIGTSTPGFPLTFKNDVGDKISLWGQSGASFGFGIQDHLLQIHANETESDIAFGTGSSASFAETMRITGNAHVGIGTSTPGFPLTFKNEVGDKISLWGQSGAHYGFGIQGGVLQIHSDGTGSDVAFGSGSSASFTETMRVLGSGALQLGKSGDPSQNAIRFTLGYTGFTPAKNTNHAEISNDLSSFGCLMLVGNTSRGPGWSDRWVGIWDSLDVANDMYVGGNTWKNINGAWRALNYGPNSTWAYWSDSRLKDDVQAVPSALSKVRQLRGVTFRWNDEGVKRFSRDIDTSISAGPRASLEEHREVREKERAKLTDELATVQVGVVAQEVEAVLPEAVTTDADGYKSVHYDKLIPLLIEAIKEQDHHLARHRREIDRLKQALGDSQ